MWQSDESHRLDASSSAVRHLGHEPVVMVDTFDDSSANYTSALGVPFAQAVDCAPSAPAYESSSMSAPATTTSSYD